MFRKLAAGFVLLGSLCCWIAATPSGSDTAQDLLAKHRAFVGWQFGDGTFGSFRISGTVKNNKGEQVSGLRWLIRGPLFRSTTTLTKHENLTVDSGFTGNVFWRSDINGFTNPLYGDASKFMAAKQVLLQEATSALPATFLRDATVDGKSVGVVRASMQGGDTIDLYVDRSTGAYVQAVIDPDGAYETTYHILSYADVGAGKKMIGSYRVDDDRDVTSFSSFDPNATVTDDDLHPPAQTAHWTFGEGAASPLTLTTDRILVDATVNGVKGRFILDTGAASIVLDDGFAQRAGVGLVKGDTASETLYGEVPTRVRRIDSLSIGGATLHGALGYSEDFRHNDGRGLDRAGYAGLIGFDVFADALVRLNTYGATLSVEDPGALDPAKLSGLPIVVDLSAGIPIVPMVLNGHIPVNAMLDTGNPGGILFGPDLVKKYDFRMMGGCTNFESLAIGPIVYRGEAACQWGVGANYALLGFDFLKHFDVVFDYSHGKLYLSPNKN